MRIMKYILVFACLLLLQCGILEHEKQDACLVIGLKQEEQGFLGKVSATLDQMRCIVSRNGSTLYDQTVSASGGRFHLEVGGLEPGSGYSVSLQGLSSGYTAVQGKQENISLASGEKKTVYISWNSYIPTLSSPSDGATGVSASPTLTWNSVSGASSYGLQVSTNSGFTSYVVNQSGIASTSYAVSGLSEGTTYYWRVNAMGPGGTSGWSDSRSFTTLTGGGQSTTIEWITVQGGTFQMGDTFGDGYSDELPVHSVTVSTFRISEYEVTNAQYAAFLNDYGSSTVKSGEYSGQIMIYENDWGVKQSGGIWQASFGYENYPVVYVTWYGAYEFCRYYGYRLPTEAEWEYAARGGSSSQGYKYAGSNTIGDVAWYYDNSGGATHSVGTKQANELGLYDMSGNVWEWCQDWYDSGYYNSSPSSNPQGPSSGSTRVLRGGGWFFDARYCRVSDRITNDPDNWYYYFGFRCARTF